METTKKTRKKNTEAGLDERIKLAYKEYLLVNGARPASIYKFCLDLDIKEDEFYTHFGSFDTLEKHIWQGFVDDTILRLQADASFTTFTTREKILAFYYTLLEGLKGNRSFILLHLQQHRRLELIPGFIKGFKASFEHFIAGILTAGKAQGEVANRPFLDKRYPQLFWLHMSFLLSFWKDDDSPGFEKTDAAVEKSVNLAFDLIGNGAVDSAIDFVKFMYQNKMK